MQLEKAGQARLIRSMVFSVILIGVFCLAAMATHSSWTMIVYIILIATNAANAHLAYMLDETSGPMMVADDRGVTFSAALSPSGKVGWHEIKSMRVTQWQYNFFIPVPGTKRLQVRFTSRDQLPPLRRWLPHGWFKILSIPAGMIGSDSGLRNFVQGQAYLAQQSRLESTGPRYFADLAPVDRPVQGPFGTPGADPGLEQRIDAAVQQALLRQKYGTEVATPPPEASPGDAARQEPVALHSGTPMLNGKPLAMPPRARGGFGRRGLG